MNYKISVIIPAHNEEKYIKKCIDSLLRNNREYIYEIIIVDNASDDKTSDIIKSYDNIRYVREDKKWLVNARQVWYKVSKGDILAYIDADSRVPQDWVDKVINHFRNDNDLAFLSWPYIYYDTNIIQKVWIRIYWIFGWYLSYLIIWYLGVWWNMIIRKNILDKIWWFDINIEFYWEDTNIARRINKVWKCIFDLRLINYTSARRLKQQWLINTWFIYVKNFLSQVLLKRSLDIDYKDRR